MSNKTQNPNVKNDIEIHLSAHFFSLLLEKIIFGGIVFILALPLLGDYGHALFPIGRDVIFKITTEFLFVLFLALLTFKHLKLNWHLEFDIWHSAKRFSPITLSLLIFWFIMALSTIFSVQLEFSLWGNIYKNQGLMTWTHYVLFFFLLISFLRDRKQWRFLINIAISVGALVSLVALWQVLGSGFSFRVASTLNNSNYLAAYLLLLIPITFAFFIKRPSLFLGFAAALQFLALISTQTRGGYLGVAAAIFVFSFLCLSTRKTYESRPKFSIFNFSARGGSAFGGQFSKRFLLSIISVIVMGIYALILFTNPGQSFQEKLPDFTNRFLSYQNIKSSSGPRLEAWSAGWKGVLEKPLLGYGPENFFVLFDKFYNGSQDHTGSLAKDGSLWETWFDKAHNFIFDIGATTGFVGLFAYLGIFASAIWILLKQKSIIAIGIASAFSGYLMQNLLGFDTTIPGIYLVFLLGYAHYITSHNPSQPPSPRLRESEAGLILRGGAPPLKVRGGRGELFSRIVLACILLVTIPLLILSFKVHLDILKANYNLNLAESLAQRGRINQAFTTYEKGLEYNSPPINPNLRRRYAVIALAYYNAVEKHCSNPTGSDPVGLDCEKFYKDSEKYLNRALVLQKENATTEWPRFTRNYIYAAQISHILGNYTESDAFFEKALELSSHRASIYVEWSHLLGERNEAQKADEKLKKAQRINPLIQIDTDTN